MAIFHITPIVLQCLILATKDIRASYANVSHNDDDCIA
jgi:hypothetical protein